MQRCKYCGWDLLDDARVCPVCGHPMDPDDEEQRRRLMLRWHLGTYLLGRKLLARNVSFAPALPAASSSIHLPVSLIVFLISIFIFVNVVLVGFLWPHHSNGLRTSSPTPSPITLTLTRHLSVSPTLLDFGEVEMGNKAVLSELVDVSSGSQLRWKIVSGNAMWLSVTRAAETVLPNNLREINYDVAANTNKLLVGEYKVTYSITSDGAPPRHVDIKIHVIRRSVSQPAKIDVNPALLDFGSQYMGGQQTLLLAVSNSGGEALSWTADKGKTSWFILDISSGTIATGGQPQIIKVKLDIANLSLANYSASIDFNSNGGKKSVRVLLALVSMTTPTPSGVMPTPTPTVPVITVTPMNIDPGSQYCSPTGELWECRVTVGETPDSPGNANWSVSDDNGLYVNFSPPNGQLSPGGSLPVDIFDLPCQSGTFTFSGQEGEQPVTVSWSCTPTPTPVPPEPTPTPIPPG